MHSNTEGTEDTESAENEQTTFAPSEEMNTHLQQLLAAAEARVSVTETANENLPARDVQILTTQPPPIPQSPGGSESRRITRSQGITLDWNPVMNSTQVIVEQ